MPRNPSLILAPILLAGLAAPAFAQMRGPGWGWSDDGARRHAPLSRSARNTSDERYSGMLEVERFVSRSGREALGHGPVEVAAALAGLPALIDRATWEAAVVDQLVWQGYDTLRLADGAGQRAELQVIREVAEPAENKRSPVSGEANVGVSNHGSYYGLGVNLDFTKPKSALLATRVNARILDAANGAVLWEARATLYSREDDEDYGEAEIARRLAEALFAEFPAGPDDRVVD